MARDLASAHLLRTAPPPARATNTTSTTHLALYASQQ